MPETRKCNVCGEEWQDTGDYECPFCGSDDTYILDEGPPADSQIFDELLGQFD